MNSHTIMKIMQRGLMPAINSAQMNYISNQLDLEVEALKKSDDDIAYKNGVMAGINRALELLVDQAKESERQAVKLIERLEAQTTNEE